MQTRLSVFRKLSFSEKDRQKWEQSQVLTIHFMSSEESEVEDDHEEVLIVKELPWRSQKVNRFFKNLDDKEQEHKTPQARRQAKKRVRDRDVISSRPVPSLADVPCWVFAE